MLSGNGGFALEPSTPVACGQASVVAGNGFMNFCFHISRRLAAYCEGEVSPDERARIAAHLEKCAGCRALAEEIRSNVQLMRQLPQVNPAGQLWGSIENRLALGSEGKAIRNVWPRRLFGIRDRWVLRPLAIVTVLAIVATSLLIASRSGMLPGSHAGELNLAGYLDLVGTVALAEPALKEFPAAPGFSEVKWPEARTAVSFPLIAPDSLPGGYQLTTVRLYTSGDLRALQFKYRSEEDGLCVFQLPASSMLSFGERPSEQYKTDGVYCFRTGSKTCSAYGFVMGSTQLVLMTRETNPAAVSALIQAFTTEYEKTQSAN